jgi:Glu-tRNA(Gln) amidotransferase subunit E-like FAD-binding protein
MQDYKKLGLKSGIEIHQQLDTAKLFCSCSGLLRADEPNIIVRRKLHAVAGETGETDVAAAYEVAREREFIYQAYSDSTCLVELDEEPPHLINEEALKIALQISLLLDAKPLGITQVMRKTVIDGSNTSGFQRTLLLAKNGWIELESGKRIGIDSICLEEDAARIIRQDEKEVTYRLDRLGIPLVEITTSPDITEPAEAKDAALKIGEILRACKVKRGIGTIRQDVNLSIAAGARTEIKGVQEPKLIAKTIEKEVERQLQLIKENKRVEASVRKANQDGSTTYLRPLPGAARMYPETDLPLIRIDKKLLDEVRKTLPKLKSELKAELRKKGLNQELAKLILQENKIEEFRELLSIYNKPNLIAKLLLLYPREIASHKKLSLQDVERKINLDIIEEILHAVKKEKIKEEQVKTILAEVVKGKTIQEALKVEKISLHELEEEIQKLIKEKPGLSASAYMGLLMQKYRGKISGKDMIDLLRKYI